jgi:hypothetical protein
MKNYFKSFMGLAVAVLMSMVAVSCEKDSSGKKGVINRDNIVGEWQLESIQYRYYENEQLVESDAENCRDSWYLIFDLQEGGVGTLLEYEGENLYRESIEWELVANKLIFIYGEDDEESYTVDSVTDNKLVLSFVEVWDEDGIECKEVVKYIFRR